MTMSRLRKGPSGASQIQVLLFGESLLLVSFKAKTEKGPEKNTLSRGLQKLSSSLPVGMSLGLGALLFMWETANNIFLLKTKLASNQFFCPVSSIGKRSCLVIVLESENS